MHSKVIEISDLLIGSIWIFEEDVEEEYDTSSEMYSIISELPIIRDININYYINFSPHKLYNNQYKIHEMLYEILERYFLKK